ncbi:MAG: YeeE/YedE family protein [Gammaproteobacteria bacterium]|nr:YeeE/YedE family protein [Gammaproteobacteria bacterium]
MNAAASIPHPDPSIVAPTVAGVALVTGFLFLDIGARQALLFLIGIGLGVVLLHAAFGFTSGWRLLVRERRGAGVRAQLLLLALTSILFFPVLGGLFSGLGAAGAVAPASVSVAVGAFLFGVGMQLGGGCGSGTLFTVGGGQVRMLITLAFFVIGSLAATAHLHWWGALPSLGEVSLVSGLGWLPGLALQLAVLAVLYAGVRALERRRHGVAEALAPARPSAGGRWLTGPWPLWWGVIGLAALNLATLLVAGHPWSITFAFGLWGAKIASALGVDVAAWPYWSAGYPAQALGHSVLADTTSLMDFGIILGAVLAAGLAGRFAPETRLRWNDVATAVIGGLLLGYGARLAFGCNIGALLAGIASGSLHGWLWLVTGFLGGLAGVRLRVAFGIDRPPGRAA